jgi:hypothetical protein
MKKVGTVILKRTPIGKVVYPVTGIVYGGNFGLEGTGFITWTVCAFQHPLGADAFVQVANKWYLDNEVENKSEMPIFNLDPQLNEALAQYERVHEVSYEISTPIEVR